MSLRCTREKLRRRAALRLYARTAILTIEYLADEISHQSGVPYRELLHTEPNRQMLKIAVQYFRIRRREMIDRERAADRIIAQALAAARTPADR